MLMFSEYLVNHVTQETLEHALKIRADTKFDRLNGPHFLSVVPTRDSKKTDTQKVCVVFTIRKFVKNLVIILNILQIIQDCVLHHVSYFILILIIGKT